MKSLSEFEKEAFVKELASKFKRNAKRLKPWIKGLGAGAALGSGIGATGGALGASEGERGKGALKGMAAGAFMGGAAGALGGKQLGKWRDKHYDAIDKAHTKGFIEGIRDKS